MTNYMDENTINTMLSFLNDESPIVRGATIDALSDIYTADYATYFLPLLNDKKRSVRVKAFMAVAVLNEFQIPEAYKEVYKKVEEEFNAQIEVTGDFSGGRAKKASYYLKKGDIVNAILWYEKALEIDNLNNIIRMNLANLYYRNKEFDKAENAFKLVIEQEPEFSQTYYSYALLLAELNRVEEAIKQMELAIKHTPNNVRFYYNLSLLYDKINKLKKAEQVAAKGLKIAPDNESLLYVLAYVYQKSGQFSKATNVASRLVQLYPNNQQYRTFYNQLKALK